MQVDAFLSSKNLLNVLVISINQKLLLITEKFSVLYAFCQLLEDINLLINSVLDRKILTRIISQALLPIITLKMTLISFLQICSASCIFLRLLTLYIIFLILFVIAKLEFFYGLAVLYLRLVQIQIEKFCSSSKCTGYFI